MRGLARRQPRLHRIRNRRWINLCSVRADLMGPQQRLILQHFAEEPLGGVQVALRGQQEIHGSAVLVDRPVKITPLATDFDIGFIDADRAAMGASKLPKSFLYQWRIGQKAEHMRMDRNQSGRRSHAAPP